MYNKNIIFYSFFLLLLQNTLLFAITTHKEVIDQKKQKISISFTLRPEQYIYKDSITVSIDSPNITISSWQSNREPSNHYDATSKETKLVFQKDFFITIIAENSANHLDEDVFLYITYQYNDHAPHAELIPLSFDRQDLPLPIDQSNAALSEEKNQKTVIPKTASALLKNSSSKTGLWHYWQYMSTLIEQTRSLPIRLFLVFLLGILLSLTPCIYPMIPITIGILQAQRGTSFTYNFLLAVFYTLGLATTFACLGLLASITGPVYGTLLVHPLSVAFIVVILLYFALSMFGLYDLYIPYFLQSQNTVKTNGSLVSAFLFGAASGTIASPCVSPGLALLLSIVATLGNRLLGFLLLFFFGIGLSTPLLLIGTFSNSLLLLPKTGAWMIEVKKFFGLMLLAVCVYYMSNIVPFWVLLFIIAAIFLLIGIYYLYSAYYCTIKAWKNINNILGMLLIGLSVIVATQGLKSRYYKHTSDMSLWLTSYDAAITQAKQEQKKIFIDCWAQFCSICTTINMTVLKNPDVMHLLKKVVPLSVDGTYDRIEPYNTIKQTYGVIGFPTFLLIDPTTQTVIKRWGSEIYHMPREQFIDELSVYAEIKNS